MKFSNFTELTAVVRTCNEEIICRRTKNVNLTYKTANDSVLSGAKKTRLKILDPIRMSKRIWMGHEAKHDGLLNDVMKESMVGKRQSSKMDHDDG